MHNFLTLTLAAALVAGSGCGDSDSGSGSDSPSNAMDCVVVVDVNQLQEGELQPTATDALDDMPVEVAMDSRVNFTLDEAEESNVGEQVSVALCNDPPGQEDRIVSNEDGTSRCAFGLRESVLQEFADTCGQSPE